MCSHGSCRKANNRVAVPMVVFDFIKRHWRPASTAAAAKQAGSPPAAEASKSVDMTGDSPNAADAPANRASETADQPDGDMQAPGDENVHMQPQAANIPGGRATGSATPEQDAAVKADDSKREGSGGAHEAAADDGDDVVMVGDEAQPSPADEGSPVGIAVRIELLAHRDDDLIST
jgi:hypothetical protein